MLTLQGHGTNGIWKPDGGATPGAIAVKEKPPRVRLIQESDADLYAKKANHIAIRHVNGDRVVAIIEILSPGNKSSQHAVDEFLDKVWSCLEQGIHLLLNRPVSADALAAIRRESTA